MTKQNIIRFALYGLIISVLTINLVMSCILIVWISEDRKSLRNVECDLQEIKEALDKEIKLRQDLFPQLKKSAQLLLKYNPRLDYMTALGYAYKIYDCSDDTVSLNILTALIVVESSADYKAVSNKGALGLTQVMPRIWKYDKHLLADPYKNIEIGSTILRHYIARHGLLGGLSAYNSGKKNRSLGYARKVIRIADRYF